LKDIHLIGPSESALDESYRSLRKGGNVSITIQDTELNKTLRILEKIGFVGIELFNYGFDNLPLNVRAYKGKHGPCYNSGRTARYIGSALAALDDDNHLLFADLEIAVCEKTAQVYGFPPYNNLIAITGGSTKLMEKLKYDPERFDLNSFDDDQLRLYKLIKGRRKEKSRVLAFYPGPFRMLILQDGTIVKRGEISNVPKAAVEHLAISDQLEKVDSDKNVKPVYFQEEYAVSGPRCLLYGPAVSGPSVSDIKTNYDALSHVDSKLKDRLKSIIEDDRKYFILTGSDPIDEFGCCPSAEVGEANKLVQSGILSSISQETNSDVCPVTIYAFNNEISFKDEDLIFSINKDLRAAVINQLNMKKFPGFTGVVKWILLGFVLVSLALAVLRFDDFSEANKQYSLYEHFSPGQENTLLILLFHNQVRCTMCLNMENHIRSLLDRDHTELLSKGEIQFILVNMNTPENQELVKRFELYTASVVMARIEDRNERRVSVLRDIWKLYPRKDKFMSTVNQQLKVLLSD
jgi:hypothetical protein